MSKLEEELAMLEEEMLKLEEEMLKLKDMLTCAIDQCEDYSENEWLGKSYKIADIKAHLAQPQGENQ